MREEEADKEETAAAAVAAAAVAAAATGAAGLKKPAGGPAFQGGRTPPTPTPTPTPTPPPPAASPFNPMPRMLLLPLLPGRLLFLHGDRELAPR